MEHLLSADQVSKSAVGVPTEVGAGVKDCLARQDVTSAQCRLLASSLITQQTKFAMPDVVFNLQDCLERRNYPQGYEVDYLFPPVGCSREASAVFIAHNLLWALPQRATKK